MTARARRLIPTGLLTSALAATSVGWAQPKADPPTAVASSHAQPEMAPEAPDSPRASFRHFIELCRAGEYDEAAAYLDIPESSRSEGGLLARRLKAVLDRHLWLEPNNLSPVAQGKQTDGLPGGVEEVGNIPGASAPEPVRLVRRKGADGVRWVFSRTTVERINSWYGQLGERWLYDVLPRPLLRPGPRELLWWQWLALPLLSSLAWMTGRFVGWWTRLAVGRLLRKPRLGIGVHQAPARLEKLKRPLALAWAIAAFYVALPGLGLYPPAEAFLQSILRALFFSLLFWVLLRVIDVGSDQLLVHSTSHERPAAASLIPLGARVAKLAIVAIAIVAILSQLGYPVASLIAGLGIGGIAIALAAQKTVENLFGSFSIGIDQPFRVGDFVKVDSISGTVETMGLRSTRIRTLDRTVVTLPNGKLADMRIETFAPRDRIRFGCTLNIVCNTPVAKLRLAIERIERVLRESPKVYAPDVSVRFREIGQSALLVEAVASYQTQDYAEFQALRENILIGFMTALEELGVELAFPTQTGELARSGTQRKAVADER